MEELLRQTFKTGDYVKIIHPQFNFRGEKEYVAQIVGWVDELAILDLGKVRTKGRKRITSYYQFKEPYYQAYLTWRLAPADPPTVEFEEITLEELNSVIGI